MGDREGHVKCVEAIREIVTAEWGHDPAAGRAPPDYALRPIAVMAARALGVPFEAVATVLQITPGAAYRIWEENLGNREVLEAAMTVLHRLRERQESERRGNGEQ